MTRINHLTILALSSALALAGCGSGSKGSSSAEPGDSGAEKVGSAPAGWNAADACSVLDKAKVGDSLKVAVPQTQLGMVHEAGAADAATSECTYLGEDGSSVARLMTRWSPVADNSAEAIATTKSSAAAAIKAFSDKPLEDVPDLGKAAFFVPAGLPSLTVFLDDARMVTVTIEKVPDGANGKDLAIALAKQAGA
ncbi:MAG: hypothetical protein KDE32_12495 [Novosphingobium sp.]|nr:hypothetical protein [Novosphingobium sp.]